MELWLSGSIISEDVNKIDKLDIPGISGVEFGFLESTDDLEIINKFVKNKNIGLGFHHPSIKACSIVLIQCILQPLLENTSILVQYQI